MLHPKSLAGKGRKKNYPTRQRNCKRQRSFERELVFSPSNPNGKSGNGRCGARQPLRNHTPTMPTQESPSSAPIPTQTSHTWVSGSTLRSPRRSRGAELPPPTPSPSPLCSMRHAVISPIAPPRHHLQLTHAGHGGANALCIWKESC